ncbi:MAG: hypothetical protein NTY65_09220 [Planctomycetota bacterium]|nr:hypothetical protein [Planctomycetota bacterium]
MVTVAPGRLKVLQRQGMVVILESYNPAFPPVELPAAKVLRTGRIIKRLPRWVRRPPRE